jgi:hypothetical protein
MSTDELSQRDKSRIRRYVIGGLVVVIIVAAIVSYRFNVMNVSGLISGSDSMSGSAPGATK